MWNKDTAERMYLQVLLQIHHSDELSQSITWVNQRFSHVCEAHAFTWAHSGWVCAWKGWLSLKYTVYTVYIFIFINPQLLYDIGNTHTRKRANWHGGERNNSNCISWVNQAGKLTPRRGEPIMLFNTRLNAWNLKAAPSACQLLMLKSSNPRREWRWKSTLSFSDHRCYWGAAAPDLHLHGEAAPNKWSNSVSEYGVAQINSSARLKHTHRWNSA